MASEGLVRLTYPHGRGLGEGIRILLCAGGIKFEDRALETHEQYLALKRDGFLLFSQVPILEIDGIVISQSTAITQYLAQKTGLGGKNPKESARINELYEGTRDFLAPFKPVYFFTTEEEARDKIQKETMPKYMPIFNKILDDNGSGFLVGDSTSLADLGLFEVLLYCVDYFGEEIFNDYSHLKSFVWRTKQNEKIQFYLTNHRKPANTQEYGDRCKRILGWIK